MTIEDKELIEQTFDSIGFKYLTPEFFTHEPPPRDPNEPLPRYLAEYLFNEMVNKYGWDAI